MTSQGSGHDRQRSRPDRRPHLRGRRPRGPPGRQGPRHGGRDRRHGRLPRPHRELAESDTPSYGVSTGFGALATRHIDPELRAQLQRSLIRSHAAGQRPGGRDRGRQSTHAPATPHPGHRPHRSPPEDGQSPGVLLNAKITPIVHEYGSLGCSGDLAPLSHRGPHDHGRRPGRGRQGELRPTREALEQAGIEPVELAAKEGLALINGTDGMLGMLILAPRRPDQPVQNRRHLRRDVRGGAPRHRRASSPTTCRDSARTRASAPPPPTCRALLRDSGHHGLPPRRLCTRVQDAYSLRCAPQVAGAARDTADHAALVASRELQAAIDNPVGPPRRPRRVERQLPRRPCRLRPRLPRHRGRRRRLHGRAPHRPHARRRPQPRPARVPRPRPGRRLRAT